MTQKVGPRREGRDRNNGMGRYVHSVNLENEKENGNPEMKEKMSTTLK